MFLYPCRLNPQIWNVKKEKERENEKVGDRLAELNEKKSDKELEARDKKQRRRILLEEQNDIPEERKLEMRADKR